MSIFCRDDFFLEGVAIHNIWFQVHFHSFVSFYFIFFLILVQSGADENEAPFSQNIQGKSFYSLFLFFYLN